MTELITETIEDLGYWGVALLTFLETLFPPLPSEVILPAAGFAASRGELGPLGVSLAGTAGSMAGAVIYYVAGKKLNQDSAREWMVRHGRWLGLSVDDLRRAQDSFRRRGRTSVLVGRCIPGVRTLISLPAGFSDMPWTPFLVYSTIGSLAWAAALTYLGAAVGEEYETIARNVGRVSLAVAATLVAIAAAWVWKRRRG